MEIVNRTEFPHLAKWQMKKAAEIQKKKTEREILEEFGRIEDQEEEDIYQLENGRGEE